MGNPYRVRLAGALAAIVLLASCSDQRAWSETEISDIARDAASGGEVDTSAIESKLSELEAENAQLKSQITTLDADLAKLRADHEAVYALVRNNAKAQIELTDYLRQRGFVQ